MADTKRDDSDASSPSIAEGEGSHEMRALPVDDAQIARENLPVFPDSGRGRGGEAKRDIERESTLQNKGPSDGDGAMHWNALENVVVPQDQGSFAVDAASTPITVQPGQGPPSFAQSEFHTVNSSRVPHRSLLNSPVHVDRPASTSRTRR